MININECIKFYTNNGFDQLNASNKVAQDIILSKIATSTLKENISIKGGVVVYNITKNKRRATQDIDISLLKYSISDESIIKLINKLSNTNDGVTLKITKNIEILKDQDYKGKRIFLTINDSFGYVIDTKIDIGVQEDLDINQEECTFYFEAINNKITLLVNTKEQIFVEKLISLLRHKVRSTRYKDIYDFYYFITETNLDKEFINYLIAKYIFASNLNIRNYDEICKTLSRIFSNDFYLRNVNNPKNNWLEVDASLAFKTVLDFITSFVKVDV